METYSKKEVIEMYPVELSLQSREAKAFRKMLKKADESFVFDFVETKSIKVGRSQYYDFQITCPTTSYANGYFHLGIMYAESVLPFFRSRYKK